MTGEAGDRILTGVNNLPETSCSFYPRRQRKKTARSAAPWWQVVVNDRSRVKNLPGTLEVNVFLRSRFWPTQPGITQVQQEPLSVRHLVDVWPQN